MTTFLKHHAFLLFLGLIFSSQITFSQTRKALSLEDYAQWNRITNASIAPDGTWVTYAYKPNEGDATMHIRKVNGDTLRTALNAKQLAFSENSNWLAYLVDPTKEETEQLKKAKKTVFSDLELLNLKTNTVLSINKVKGFRFSKTAQFIAIHKNPTEEKAKHSGSDLLLKDLQNQQSLNIGNVSDFSFNKDGTLFAYTVDADSDSGNGLYLVDLSNLRTWPLHTSTDSYTQMTWNEKGDRLAILFGKQEDDVMQAENSLYWTGNLIAGMKDLAQQNTYDPKADVNFPKHMVISSYGNLSWNVEGTQIYHGIKAQQPKLNEEDSLKANVDVWHWKDERVQSRQMVQANADRKTSYISVLNLDTKTFVQLESEIMPVVRTNDKSTWALGRIDTLYRKDVSLPDGYADLYAVDTRTGKSRLIASKVYRDMGRSPDGRWTLFSREGVVMGYNFSSQKTTNLTERTGLSFQNEDFDRPVEKPSYGVAGWSKDGQTLILNHKYDLWAIGLNTNEAFNLTKGKGTEDNIRFRLVQLDQEAETFDLKKPLLLSAYGDKTKKSGYFEVKPGKSPTVLHYKDKMIRGALKASKADRIFYTEQTFEEFPDYWITSSAFKSPEKITNANPQQINYKWGKRILVDYTDQRGHQLQATLALPADYEPSKTYPMIVYFYEKMSQRHHQYSMPTYDDRPHMSTYASNGYLVLMPDIIYDEGLPGSSALDDITSAAKAVIDLGYADPDRIGLQGHSWGGYQSSFILTQTDMFATVVTGAPLTNLISMYTIAYKRSGNLNGPILEWSQGRMGLTPWDNMELYRSQSPIHHTPKINTPFLILHGTSDGAVDWNQGLEFYSAARRLGKEVILLSYPKEPHHLRKEANQKDFQIRMKQYFDHYLKDMPAPLWMQSGVPHLKKHRLGPEVMQD